MGKQLFTSWLLTVRSLGPGFTWQFAGNGHSQVPAQNYWIGICILTRFPSDSCAHYGLRITTLQCLHQQCWWLGVYCVPKQGCQCFKNSLSFNLQNNCEEKNYYFFFFLIDGEMKMRDWTIKKNFFAQWNKNWRAELKGLWGAPGDAHSISESGKPLEQKMATHSGILAGKIPWTEKPGRLQSMGSQRVRHDWMTEHRLKEDSMRVMERAWALKLDRHLLNFLKYLLFIWLC